VTPRRASWARRWTRPVSGEAGVAGERGVVALETALVLPVVVLLLVGVLGLLGVVQAQLEVEQAARAGARAAAVTGNRADGLLVAGATSNASSVTVVVRGARVTVEVVAQRDVLGVPVWLSATAVAPLEPGARP
jgi:Flp pilus assembly protein TadG